MVTGQVSVQVELAASLKPVPVVANCNEVAEPVFGTAVPNAVTLLNPQDAAGAAAVIVQELGTVFRVRVCPPTVGIGSAALNTTSCAAVPADRF